jgi:diguanylate cyclase (GGDEF)-like protein
VTTERSLAVVTSEQALLGVLAAALLLAVWATVAQARTQIATRRRLRGLPGPAPAPADAAREQTGTGVTSRLVVLFMLPVVVLCVLAGSAISTHRASAASAELVDRGAVELSHVVSLRDALQAQHRVAAFEVRVRDLNTTMAVVSEFFGIDLRAELQPAREQATRAIEELGARAPITDDTLTSLYADIDSHEVDADAAVVRLRDHLDVIDDALAVRFRELRAHVDDPALVATLESLETASGLMDAATKQGIELSEVWFPTPGATPQRNISLLTQFGADTASYRAAVDELRALGVDAVLDNLARIEADPDVAAFHDAVDAGLAGGSAAVAGVGSDAAEIDDELLPVIDDAFRGYFTRDDKLDGLLATANRAVRAEAQRAAAAGTAQLETWTLGTAVLAVVSLGIARWVAQSIAKPLRSMAGYAQAVNGGNLDARPSTDPEAGPRETRVAFAVFADLVENLKLLDAKANALAHCNFDDPVLRANLPGRLGRSLDSSVALLSGSIVERDQLQSHLAHEATHDALTGIHNRPAAISAIDAAMQRAARSGAATGVLFIDLNEFKSINDSHGHEVGDQVLREVAERARACLRGGDVIARLGGDEFVVIAEAVKGPADATDLARRLIETISQPIDVDGVRVSVGAAVGIALSLDGPEDPLRLLARADAAMYRAKHNGASAIEMFDDELQQQLVQREDIETALTAALADPTGGGLHLHYQPVLDSSSSQMVAAEALIRWDRPGHGMLSPDAFIPIAEATGLIIDVDRWVLAEATRQLREWSADPALAELAVAVNISGRHLLSRTLADSIRAALDSSGVDPHRLSIEITETVLLADLAAAATELHAVRSLGVRVAIDDFGTGYTSLAHLQHLPVDTIKIDRSFISQLNVRRGSSLVRMVTDLGHAIDINIVAEGVETDDELRALQDMGADHLQGYLLSRPLQPAVFETWAREQATGDAFARTG